MKPKIEEVMREESVSYNLLAIETPVLTGFPFKLLAYIAYTRFGKYLLLPQMLRKSNLYRMGEVQMPEKPTFYPLPDSCVPKDFSISNEKVLSECVEKEIKMVGKSEFHLPTVVDYVRAYRSGKTTPTMVAEAILKAIVDSDKASPPLRAIVQSDHNVVLAMAAASDKRWKEGKTLSYLDGVPVSIKEEFHCEPYEFRGGASYLPTLSQGVPEAVCVQKLKAAGAMIIGISNMHEFGTGTSGSNPHLPQLTGRNPYDPNCYAGGSSTGAASSVAAGFCPVAIGADGGGSIRIPASLCGTVGLKPTVGVVDVSGLLPKVFTVVVAGPLSSSVLDTAITMNVISGDKDGKRMMSLEGLGETSRLDGLRVGIYWDHFNHAEEEIKLKCRAALSILNDLGAELVDISIPEMEDTRIAHVISIGAEFACTLGLEVDQHYSELNPETHLVIGASSDLTAIDFINSQKQRTRAMRVLETLFEKVDVIATPGVACSPPEIKPEHLSCGVADGTTSSKLMRFSFLANLTGIPGLVVPVGYTGSGLPVSLQLMGSWYREDVLLKTGLIMEQSGRFPARKPKVFYDVINN